MKHIALGKFSIDFSEEGFDPVGIVSSGGMKGREVYFLIFIDS